MLHSYYITKHQLPAENTKGLCWNHKEWVCELHRCCSWCSKLTPAEMRSGEFSSVWLLSLQICFFLSMYFIHHPTMLTHGVSGNLSDSCNSLWSQKATYFSHMQQYITRPLRMLWFCVKSDGNPLKLCFSLSKQKTFADITQINHLQFQLGWIVLFLLREEKLGTSLLSSVLSYSQDTVCTKYSPSRITEMEN